MKIVDYPLLNLANARILQETLCSRVITQDSFDKIKYVAGCDVSCNRFSRIMHAGCAIFSTKTWLCDTQVGATETTTFPYIPGYLGFREVPSLVAAFQKIPQLPDIVFVDGQGICHPRGFGVASHLGVILDIPTIGIGKSILIGKPAGTLGSLVGDTTALVWEGKTVGMLLRSKKNCEPLIISIGHKISLQTALNLVLDSLKGYRLPEPTRLAHIVANRERLTYAASYQKTHSTDYR